MNVLRTTISPSSGSPISTSASSKSDGLGSPTGRAASRISRLVQGIPRHATDAARSRRIRLHCALRVGQLEEGSTVTSHEARGTGCAVCDAGLHAHADEVAAAEALAAEGIRRRAFLGTAAGAAVAFGAWRPGIAAARGHDRDPGPQRSARTMVLEPSWVLTYENDDLQLRRDRSVVVQDGRISAIVAGRVRGRDARLEMPGQLLIPGMISGHTHVALGSPTRG